MAEFNPDSYLSNITESLPEKPEQPKKVTGFDPDAYLANKPAEQKEPEARTGTAMALGAVQGATFGFADEMAAAAKTAIDATVDFTSGKKADIKKKYEEQLTKIRDYYKKLEQENPKAFLGGELAGGFIMPGGMAAKAVKTIIGGVKGAKAAKTAATIGKTVAEGAGIGATTAAGYSEAKDTGELAEDITKGAATGAAFGGVIGGATKFGKWMGDAVGKAADKMALRELGFTKPSLTKVTPEKQQALLDLAKKNNILADTAEQTGKNAQKLRMEAGDELNGFISKAAKHDANFITPNKAVTEIKSILPKYDFETTRPVYNKLTEIMADVEKTNPKDLIQVTNLRHAIGSLTTEPGEVGRVAKQVYGQIAEDVKDNLEKIGSELAPDVRSTYETLNNNYHLANLISDVAVKKANRAMDEDLSTGILHRLGSAAVVGAATGHPLLSAQIAATNIGMDLLRKKYGTELAMKAKSTLESGGPAASQLSQLLNSKDLAGVAAFLSGKSNQKDINEQRKTETKNLLKQLKMPQ